MVTDAMKMMSLHGTRLMYRAVPPVTRAAVLSAAGARDANEERSSR